MLTATTESIIVAGDWHGDSWWATRVVSRAAKTGHNVILQVGDFGLWPDGDYFLDELEMCCAANDVFVYAVMGNHDWNSRWRALVAGEKNRDEFTGGVHVRDHIILLPVTGSIEVSGKILAWAGGASSIDRNLREPGLSWWEEEVLTDEDISQLPDRKVDFLFTHDASNRSPFVSKLIPDLDSRINRMQIDKVLDMTRPTIHFHGHYHIFEHWINRVGADHRTITFSLDMNQHPNSTGKLDLANYQFTILH